ncbi:MAG: hypothetical protein IPH58_17430 [Sphingobacteriales bacterium]|nr:hypothetical protein [Sphingobacteriales bacterium]
MDYNVMKNMAINWSHQSDMRSRPGTSFGANVNYSTTRNNQTYMSNYQERFPKHYWIFYQLLKNLAG